jgi:hypothetical protein
LSVLLLHLKCILPTPFNSIFWDKNSHWYKSVSSFCSFCRSTDGKIVAFKIQLGMALLVSGFCILTVTERHNKTKHMQFLSGVSILVYWLSALVFDLIIFFISCCFLLVSANNVVKVSFY